VAVDRKEKEFRKQKEDAKKLREQRKMEKRVGVKTPAAKKGVATLRSATKLLGAAALAKKKVAAAAAAGAAAGGAEIAPPPRPEGGRARASGSPMRALVRSPSGMVTTPQKPGEAGKIVGTRRRSSPVRPPGGPGLKPPAPRAPNVTPPKK
jgi:hypothetical protein